MDLILGKVQFHNLEIQEKVISGLSGGKPRQYPGKTSVIMRHLCAN